jgi:small subunit ribosomal protein S6
MNIECAKEILDEIESAFRFNDAVLRHLTLSCKEAVTEKSAMMKEVEREESGKTERRPAASEPEAPAAEAAETVSTEEVVADAEPVDEPETVTAEAGVE